MINREWKALKTGSVYFLDTFFNGKKYLQKQGFMQCKNPRYLQKAEIYVHYNKLMKAWIKETKP